MDQEIKTILGGILTALVVERAAKLMRNWEIDEQERGGNEAVEMPPPEQFIDHAMDEISEHKARVIARLFG